ncbi:MAG: hypothetical protein NZL83_03265 [Candidatus Absconditabacterales bacterium]|nr:hypothetical protein [Candidatus Absconditabacterales bacterium]
MNITSRERHNPHDIDHTSGLTHENLTMPNKKEIIDHASGEHNKIVLDTEKSLEQGAIIDHTDMILDTTAKTIKLESTIVTKTTESSLGSPKIHSGYEQLTPSNKAITADKEPRGLMKKIGIGAGILGGLYLGYKAWQGISSLWKWAFGDKTKEEKKESSDTDKEQSTDTRQSGFFSSAREWTKNLAIGGGILLAGGFIAKQLGITLPSRLSRGSLAGLFSSQSNKEKKDIITRLDEITKRLDDAKQKLPGLSGSAKNQTEQAIQTIMDQVTNIKESLGLDKQPAQEQSKEKKEQTTESQRTDFVTKQKETQRKKWEEISKKSIDPTKRSIARDKRTSANKEKISKLTHLHEEGGGFVSTGLDIATLPATMIFSYMLTLVNEGIIDRSDLAIIPLDHAKKGMYAFGKHIPTLFGHAREYCRGEISLEEIAQEIHESDNQLSPETRMNLWSSLYRHGGLLKTLSHGIGTITGHLTKVILEGGSTSLGGIDALVAGITQDMTKQGKILIELEKTLAGTAHLGPIMANYHDTIRILKENTIIINALKTPGITTLDELHNLMQKNGHGQIMDDFLAKITSKAGLEKQARFDASTKKIKPGTSLADLKGIFGDACMARTQDMLAHAESLQGGRTAWFKSAGAKLNPRAYATQYTYHRTLTQHISSLAKTQERLLQSDKAWNIVSNLFHRSKQGLILKDMLETNGQIKLHLSSIKDAQEFFANIKTLSLHAPELLGTIAKSLPLIFVGGEVLAEMEKDNSNIGMSLMKGFGSLIPFVGPIMLISHATQFGPGFDLSTIDRTGAGFGVGLLGYDTFRLAKNVSLAKMLGQSTPAALGRFMTEPIRDVGYLVKKASIDLPATLWKLTKDGRRVIATGGIRAFLKEGLRFVKGSSKRVAILAVLGAGLYGGYKALIHNEELDQHEQALMAKLNENPDALNTEIAQGRKDMTPDEQAQCIKLAITHKLLCSDDMITVQKKNNGRHILVNHLVAKDDLLAIRDTINEALTTRGDTTRCSIGYSHAGKRAIIETINNHTNGNNHAQLSDYLASLGYSKEDYNALGLPL